MAANLPMATLGVQAAGAGMSTVGSYYSARNDRLNLGLQADLADTNARIAELGAQSALAQGAREEQRSRLQTAQLKSAQRTAMAANGIDLGEGTAAQVLTATDLMGQIDAETIRANAARSAWGYRTQAVDAKNQALISRAGAKSISPVSSTAASLLGNAGSVAQTWYQFNQAGAKGFGDKVAIKDTGKQTGSWW